MTALISLTIEGYPDLKLRPYSVNGTEEMSQLYEFDIDCLGPEGDAAEALDLIGKRATPHHPTESRAIVFAWCLGCRG